MPTNPYASSTNSGTQPLDNFASAQPQAASKGFSRKLIAGSLIALGMGAAGGSLAIAAAAEPTTTQSSPTTSSDATADSTSGSTDGDHRDGRGDHGGKQRLTTEQRRERLVTKLDAAVTAGTLTEADKNSVLKAFDAGVLSRSGSKSGTDGSTESRSGTSTDSSTSSATPSTSSNAQSS